MYYALGKKATGWLLAMPECQLVVIFLEYWEIEMASLSFPSHNCGQSDWQFLPTTSKEEEIIQFLQWEKNHTHVLTLYHLRVFFM